MRNAIGLILRLYSYLFHLILSVFLIGLSAVASSAEKPLKLDMLPWEGERLNTYVLSLGILGLILVILAMTDWLRYLFPLWALFIFVVMFRGLFLTSYHFAGEDQFRGAAWLTLGAFGAFLSSLSVLHARGRRR